TPISLVNLLEANTQWTVSNFGLDILQTPREDTACQYVVLSDSPLEIEDMTKDKRFCDKDYVTEDPLIRYYYGVPLTTPDGTRIGAMCVMDTKKNDLPPEKEEFLKIIAKEVIIRIEYEHKLKLMRSNVEELKEIQRKVSHDIRGPIGGIIGIAEILHDQAEESKMEEFMQLLELINKGGRSVLDLADEILNNYKEGTNFEKVSSSELTLEILQNKLIDLYQPPALSKSIEYSVEIENSNQEITFPKQKLLQIFGNLISNSIKFTPEKGSVTVYLKIDKEPENTLQAEIRDTGVGMTKDQIQEMMSGNARSTAGTKDEWGFGLGFQLAQYLTESLHGKLKIDSEPDKGSSITVHIPLD
ncbi:MAG TPA: ATP-binding protein, partial [Gracilimonas sp.]|uniref:GAF domain-containing sensor histidine kinase n=1 Tax=Gracilimonas sp. TaxID=1974203 RepID=UPI002D974162|nr:ATP-binding protein [Gracilimonas sp.]